MTPKFPRRGLYLITPDSDDNDALIARVEGVLPFAACLQYRNKRAHGERRESEAGRLRALCDAAGVFFIINDDVALAVRVGADGVHLGEDDGDIAATRAVLGPNVAIGASCYDDASLARTAVAAGADYVAFGARRAWWKKETARRASPALFAEAASLGVPRVAIGGITPDNAPQAVAAGADLLAAIGGVFDAPDPVDAARRIASAFDPLPPESP